jgi:hypothetical protein
MDRMEQLHAVHVEAAELFRRKNTDYGDAFVTFGPIGVIVRIEDKIKRCISIETNGVSLINEESMRDTMIDLHNYAAMVVMLLDEKKQV